MDVSTRCLNCGEQDGCTEERSFLCDVLTMAKKSQKNFAANANAIIEELIPQHFERKEDQRKAKRLCETLTGILRCVDRITVDGIPFEKL